MSPSRAAATLRQPGSLCDLFQADTVMAPLKATSKRDALEQMVHKLVATGRVTKAKGKEILQKVLEREAVGTTGIGRGFAVPHARYSGVDRFLGVFAHVPEGVEFESLDGSPARALFLVISPMDLKQEHLQLMSRLTRLINHPDFMTFLKSCKTPKDYVDLLAELEPPA